MKSKTKFILQIILINLLTLKGFAQIDPNGTFNDGIKINRASNLRSQIYFSDSGNDLWRVGLTGANLNSFHFYDVNNSRDILKIEQNGNMVFQPSGFLEILQNNANGLVFSRDSHISYELLLAGGKGLYIKISQLVMTAV